MNVVEGLNKVDCFVADSSDNGKTVTISNDTNSWEEVVSNLHAVFMIPNMPAPAKSKYTITLHTGDALAAAQYTRDIELGFGDSVKIGLFPGDERATRANVTSINMNISALQTALNGKITYGTGDKADGSSYLETGTIYCYY